LQAFKAVQGVAAPFPGANVDTDVIMPKQYLKGLDRSGLAEGAFRDLRFDTDGRPKSDFVLNQPAWRDVRFLVVGPNFGCGSSREHAVWGLQQIGVRAILGTSFAGIFFDNCANNGVLALSLAEDEIADLLELAADPAQNRLEVDLEAQSVTSARGPISFEIEALRRERFLLGLDPVAATLKDSAVIRDFEAKHFTSNPWLGPRS
jgi:3-isopropylmalate/(R)-2-methylmalate dehydratase small subunit